MMKTLITSNLYKPNVGGVENSLEFLCRESAGKAIIVTSDIGYDESYVDAQDLTVIRYSVSKSKFKVIRFLSHLRSGYSQYRALFRSGSRKAISRYHLNCVLLYLAGFRNIGYLVPGVVKNQNQRSNLQDGSSSLFSSLRYQVDCLVQGLAFRMSSDIFVFSENMKDQVNSVYNGITVNMVKPGVDTSIFFPIKRPQDGRVKFITVSRLVGAKALDLAVQAFFYLPENYELDIYGEGPEFQNLQDLIRNHDLSERIRLRGKTLNPASCYQSADYFLLPSTYEPFGQTILEASATGLPTIAFNSNIVHTATYEILEEDAFYCNELSAKAYACCILNAVEKSTEDSRKALSTKIAERYSWGKLFRDINDAL